MKIDLNIPDYSPADGIVLNWKDNYQIKVSAGNGGVLIEANSDGLISLANHLLNLAQPAVPKGVHIHFDEFNSLDDGSTDLVIEKL